MACLGDVVIRQEGRQNILAAYMGNCLPLRQATGSAESVHQSGAAIIGSGLGEQLQFKKAPWRPASNGGCCGLKRYSQQIGCMRRTINASLSVKNAIELEAGLSCLQKKQRMNARIPKVLEDRQFNARRLVHVQADRGVVVGEQEF